METTLTPYGGGEPVKLDLSLITRADLSTDGRYTLLELLTGESVAVMETPRQIGYLRRRGPEAGVTFTDVYERVLRRLRAGYRATAEHRQMAAALTEVYRQLSIAQLAASGEPFVPREDLPEPGRRGSLVRWWYDTARVEARPGINPLFMSSAMSDCERLLTRVADPAHRDGVGVMKGKLPEIILAVRPSGGTMKWRRFCAVYRKALEKAPEKAMKINIEK